MLADIIKSLYMISLYSVRFTGTLRKARCVCVCVCVSLWRVVALPPWARSWDFFPQLWISLLLVTQDAVCRSLQDRGFFPGQYTPLPKLYTAARLWKWKGGSVTYFMMVIVSIYYVACVVIVFMIIRQLLSGH